MGQKYSLDKQIKAIIKDMNANRPVEKIAERNNVDKEFVEVHSSVHSAEQDFEFSTDSPLFVENMGIT